MEINNCVSILIAFALHFQLVNCMQFLALQSTSYEKWMATKESGLSGIWTRDLLHWHHLVASFLIRHFVITSTHASATKCRDRWFFEYD